MLLAIILAATASTSRPVVPVEQLKARVVKGCHAGSVDFTRGEDGIIHVTPSRDDSWRKIACTIFVLQKAGETVAKLDFTPEGAAKP